MAQVSKLYSVNISSVMHSDSVLTVQDVLTSFIKLEYKSLILLYSGANIKSFFLIRSEALFLYSAITGRLIDHGSTLCTSRKDSFY